MGGEKENEREAAWAECKDSEQKVSDWVENNIEQSYSLSTHSTN